MDKKYSYKVVRVTSRPRSKRLRDAGAYSVTMAVSGLSGLYTMLSQKADRATTLAGYGITDAYTMEETNELFVTVSTDQDIDGRKTFSAPIGARGGVEIPVGKALRIGDVELVYDAAAGGIRIKGGGVWADTFVSAKGVGAGGSASGGLDLAALSRYLVKNGYVTEAWIDERDYATRPELEAKADASDTIAGYGISDAYTIEETETLVSMTSSRIREALSPGLVMEFHGFMTRAELMAATAGKLDSSLKWDFSKDSRMRVYWVADALDYSASRQEGGQWALHDTVKDLWNYGSIGTYWHCRSSNPWTYMRGPDFYRLENLTEGAVGANHRHELRYIGSLTSGSGVTAFAGVVEYDHLYYPDTETVISDPDRIIFVKDNPDPDYDPMEFNGGFLAEKDGAWYTLWEDAGHVGEAQNGVYRPVQGRIYLDTSTCRLYVGDSESGLTAADAFAHDGVVELKPVVSETRSRVISHERSLLPPVAGIMDTVPDVTEGEPPVFAGDAEVWVVRPTVEVNGMVAIGTAPPMSEMLAVRYTNNVVGSFGYRWVTGEEWLRRHGYLNAERYIIGDSVYTVRATESSGGSSGTGLITQRKTVYTWTLLGSLYLPDGGAVAAHRLAPDDFETALRTALAYAKANGLSTVDCTWFTGEWRCKERFIVDFPVNIRLGNVTVTMEDTLFFDIRSNNVKIQGVNRQTDRTVNDSNATVLVLEGVSNLSTEGYHIYSRGNKNCQYRDMVLRGKQTSSGRQCNNASYPIDGTGGIYIEKGNPGTTSSGNTINATILDNLLIDGTKAHAIYLDTPILSMIRDVRISYAGGHGVFISGGTSTTLESVYVASARYAGFCLQGITYCTVFNSVAENCGCGWWLRSVFNTSLFSPGVETTYNYGLNPWAGAYRVSKRYGLAVDTTAADGTPVRITDVPDDSWAMGSRSIHARSLFCGYAFVITGGRNVDIYSPYCISIANELSPASPLLDAVKDQLCLMMILGNSRAVKVSNAMFQERNTSPIPAAIRHEIEIAAEASGMDLSYNPDSSMMPSWTAMSPVTDDETKTAPVLCLSKSALVHCGNRFYTNVQFLGNIEIGGAAQIAGQIVTDTGIITKGPIINYDEAALNLQYVISPDSSEIDYSYNGTEFRVVPKATFALDNVTADTRFSLLVDGVELASTTGGNEMSFKLSNPGAHSIVLHAAYGDKSAETEPRTVTVKEPANLPIRFIATELLSTTSTTVLLRITYQGTYVVTEAGIAYSNTNQSPTTSQNARKLSSLDLITTGEDGITHTYEIELPRANAATTRYVRGYVRAREDADATSAYAYYDTVVYKVTGDVIEAL